MGCLLRLCGLFFVAILIGLLITFLVNAVEDTPAIKRTQAVNLQDLKTAQQLAKRYNLHLNSSNKFADFPATTREINTFVKVAVTSIPNVATQVKAGRSGIIIKMSVGLPQNPLGSYLNIRAIITSFSQRLKFHRFFVGQVEVPRKFIKPVLHYFLDQITGQGKADKILNSIHSVKVLGSKVYVRFQPSAYLAKDIKAGSTPNIGHRINAIGIQR